MNAVSERLKTIVAKGSRGMRVADPERLAGVVKRFRDQMVGSRGASISPQAQHHNSKYTFSGDISASSSK